MPIVNGKPQSNIAKSLRPLAQSNPERFMILVAHTLDKNGLLDPGVPPTAGPATVGRKMTRKQTKFLKKNFDNLSPKDKKTVVEMFMQGGARQKEEDFAL